MRLYSFVNMYLSGKQQGIQTAHVVSEMAMAEQTTKVSTIFNEWAKNHKTIIMLNGGNCASLEGIYDHIWEFVNSDVFERHDCNIPMSVFYEDEQSLNGAPTAVGVVLPEWLYDEEKALEKFSLCKNDGKMIYVFCFIDWLKSFSLA